MSEEKRQSFMRGAAILAAAQILSKVVSAIFKVPVLSLLGNEGSGYFQVAYQVYTLLLAISTVGIPVALSRQISAAAATGQSRLVKKYYTTSLPLFMVIGAVLTLVMLVFAEQIAALINAEFAEFVAPSIRALAPAILFACAVSVFRGYTQGRGNMMPTAVSQIIEVVCKMVFGLALVALLLRRGFAVRYVTAGSMAGIAIGLGLSIPVLWLYKRRIDRRSRLSADGDTGPLPGTGAIISSLLKISMPIALGSTFMSILALIDTSVVSSRLVHALGMTGEETAYQIGIYARGLTLFNLPAALIVPVSISIVPAISAAIAQGRQRDAGRVMQTAFRLTNLLAMPAGVGLCILAGPIFNVLYGNDGAETGTRLLAILGIAAYFMCMQLITTAILQANGYERIPMFSYLIGGTIQVVCDYILVGNPRIGILGSPVGSLLCYMVITVVNLIFIVVKVKGRPKLAAPFLRPLLCTAVMGVAAYAAYGLIERVGSGILGDGRMAMTIYLAGAILVSVIIYGILILVTGAVTRADILLLPKGEKLAAKLKLRP